MTSDRSSVPSSLPIDRLQGQLADLENRHIELLIKFKAEDCVVVGVNEEIAGMQRQLAAASSATTQEQSTEINPLYQTLETKLAQTQSNPSKHGHRRALRLSCPRQPQLGRCVRLRLQRVR